jgi:primosomal protein DnaI
MYTPIVENDNLVFSHNICKYKKNLLDDIDYLKNSYVFTVAKEVRNAKMKDIYTDDKKRLEVLTWMTTFIKEYKKGKAWKGLYLSGNFGSGKSYLLSAMINEIVKSGKKASLVYYPEFLRSLKASFGKDFDEQFNYAKNADLLLLDDIGAENVTSWSRDEVLGPILQYRMDEKLPTFFTSNLSLEELEVHLSESKDKIDKIKAKRIIERIKYITDDIKLISENRRN